MSKKNLYLLGIALTLFFGALLYQNFCCNCGVNPPESDANPVVVASNEAVFDPFAIKGPNFDYHCIDNIKFVKNGSTAIVPFTDSVSIGFEKLKLELASNPSKKVKITGYATTDEKNTTTFPNLAIARANDLKTHLVSNGFNDAQFELEGIMKDKWQMVSDTLVGPASFEIFDGVVSGDEWTALKDKINANPLVLYFDTNKSSENVTAEEQAKIADIVRYVQNVPEARINVVGHTDNVGTKEANASLGQTRATFAKNYLIKQGVAAAKIDTESQGQDAPIADNTTEAGKTQNRRSVITIK